MTLFGDSERISVVAQLQAESGREDEVRRTFTSLAGSSRKENGCLKYDVFQDKRHSDIFFTYEEWDSEESLQKHLAHNRVALENARAMLRADVQISVLKQVA
jgi:quinol monooxygenase YgiN